ncbi:glycogen debranching enzyme [Trichomonascus vanleenenianus]|uniref:bifunctional 4-alpha-glucanotransferase/amylo-alpha-1,6-glucosidase n=1 Tax=Trichomonascus vanleenenianus TaxID=2268995 RepID=UPI003ECBA510
MGREVFFLPLGDNGEPKPGGEGDFLQLPIPSESYVLRLIIESTSPITNQATLHCNAPPRGEKFDRNKFYKYPIRAKFDKDTSVDVEINYPGTYSFYISYLPVNPDFLNRCNPETHMKSVSEEFLPHTVSERSLFKDTYMAADVESSHTSTRKYYFTVSCGFELNGKPLPLNSLQIETVVSKWMGPVDSWDEQLAAIKYKGYNMVHFTPLQHRGHSDSPYSIYDQLTWDPKCFPRGEKDVMALVETMEKKHHLLALTDIVFNHTSDDSQWLRDHPEVGYSQVTAPHLIAAIELEDELMEFSSKLPELGLPTKLKSEADLDRLMDEISKHVVQKLRLWEYYVIDVQTTLEHVVDIVNDDSRYYRLLPTRVPDELWDDPEGLSKYVIEEAGSGFDRFGSERFLRRIDPEYFVSILKTLVEEQDEVVQRAEEILNAINVPYYKLYDEDKARLLDNLKGRTRFTRMDPSGPQLGEISRECPIPEHCFTRITATNGKKYHLANNGFIWNGDPLVDFASEKSNAYLRRDIIPWGDCVKLRYGKGPKDCPYLWERMTKYTELLAKHFHGFRIDNAHSTPIHVAEYFLDKARLIRNNLYVAAELFTGNEDKDKVFVRRLGLTSLIREAMQAWSPGELSRLVHKHGGRPIGSFSKQPLTKLGKTAGEHDEDIHLLRIAPIHALFMDCTHDNVMPAQKRTVEDTLPNAALVAMCACAVGSTMGFDEGYPKHLSVVNEKRRYTYGGGIGSVKRRLYEVHELMGIENAGETYIHHEGQYITVHRVNPKEGTGYFLIARTKFHNDVDQKLNDIVLQGTQACVDLAVTLKVTGEYKEDAEKLTSIPTEVVDIEAPEIIYDEYKDQTIIKAPKDFPQGSIILLNTWYTEIEYGLDKLVRGVADDAVKSLNLLDLNVVLYRCESEERNATKGQVGPYEIPGYGKLTYAGLQGWISPLVQMVSKNDMGHPICQNLRDGKWALDYIVDRLRAYVDEYPNLTPLIDWLQVRVDRLKKIPPHLLPRYFALLVFNAYNSCRRRILHLMPTSISRGGHFLRSLALTSVQLVGKVPSASIFPDKTVGALAAGLPHFSVEYMRCWGRDVFIAFRGLLLMTGRFEDAKNHLLAFAMTLKHGLIPNLLDSGNNPRYNARDATWFFLQSLQDYCQTAPEGLAILQEKVKRRFPKDDTYVPVDDSRAFSEESTIAEIVYEILSRHAAGIKFREANAGPNLDSQMKDEGFNQEIYVDWHNGFVFGGNQWNCGTWMDKMGESEKAGNKGFPGTPRDGAAVEITGMLKSALRWVVELHEEGKFEWDYVVNQHGDKVRFKDWDRKIQRSFQKAYFIPSDPRKDVLFDVRPKLISRRGIYKDLYKSGKPFEDYQLRPNFTIAMCCAPELFDLDKALGALAVADSVLRGPVGMRTLDPNDENYRPYYRNSVDNDDFATSKGRNYHQGPEWVWCFGYFLRALLWFDMANRKVTGGDQMEIFQQLHLRLAGNRQWLHESPWAGLTELTNKDGEFCNDSSPTQAWSSATLIEVFEDARIYLDNELLHP